MQTRILFREHYTAPCPLPSPTPMWMDCECGGKLLEAITVQKLRIRKRHTEMNSSICPASKSKSYGEERKEMFGQNDMAVLTNSGPNEYRERVKRAHEYTKIMTTSSNQTNGSGEHWTHWCCCCCYDLWMGANRGAQFVHIDTGIEEWRWWEGRQISTTPDAWPLIKLQSYNQANSTAKVPRWRLFAGLTLSETLPLPCWWVLGQLHSISEIIISNFEFRSVQRTHSTIFSLRKWSPRHTRMTYWPERNAPLFLVISQLYQRLFNISTLSGKCKLSIRHDK